MNANMTAIQDPQALIEEVAADIKKEVDPIAVAIEGFAAEDFDTEAPYMFCLMNHGNDEVRFQRLQVLIKRQAERCKIKTGERSDFAQMRKTVFSAHPNLLPRRASVSPMVGIGFPQIESVFGDKSVDYAGYTCSDSGIVGTAPDGRPVLVCRQPLVVSRRYVNRDDPEHPRETVDVSFFKGGRWRTIPQIPRANLMSVREIVKELAPYGVSCPPETVTRLATYIDAFDQANGENGTIPEVNATGKIGWYQGVADFIPYSDKVFYDGSVPNTRGMYLALREQGTFEGWLSTVKPILDRKDPRNVPNKILIEGGSFGSVLVKLLKKNCFWVNLNSTTSASGKSVVLMAAASVWGNPYIGDEGYVLAMSGTVNGLEEKAHFCNNLPLCLDEIQTMQDCADWKPLLYRLCQGKGKNRAGKWGDRFWRLIILSTGEMNIIQDDAHEGEINRIVDLLVYGDLMDRPERVADALLENYGFAGQMFVNAIREHETEQTLLTRFYEIRAEFLATQKTKKQADAGAMIVLASELANLYVLHGDPLTVEDVMPWLATKEQVDINRRAYDQFQDFVTENIECFVAKGNQNPKRVFGKIMDDGKVRILPGVFKSEFLQRHQYSYQAFTGWCVRNGIITKNADATRLGIDTRLWDDDLGKVAKRPCLEFDLNKEVGTASSAGPDTITVTHEPEQQAMNIDEQSGFAKVNDSDLPF